ncbi:MAG: helix-turn-helix transcriptional regulator [Oscillospiraceae bacterium]|nr:helix-turn-helix transcriptional regulator [Oscillospiraceae bacterium]MBQ9938012.1 helix-turn-helix transcriptional regulator [Oscillospiraceae bacterium]
MNLEFELNFLCDILKKCHIRTGIISPLDKVDSIIDPRLGSIVSFDTEMTVQKTVGNLESNTKYKLLDDFKLQYIFLKLPVLSEKNILTLGPYLSFPLSSKDILEVGERIGIAPAAQKMLKEYYSSVPIIPENDSFFSLVDTFCERIWQSPSFAIVELNKNYGIPPLSIDTASKGETFDELAANITMMEARYSFENELMRAVALGQQHKVSLLAAAANDQMFEKRVADPVRNAKNYCIIMNTLLRKAAEQGGVHPVYIDRLSSKYAMKIELLSDTKSLPSFMKEIFSSYCRLVYKHSMKNYSPIVKKTILIIDSDISAELSLNTLAKKQGISAGYLATIFKKETGKTVSEYVKDKRIDHAVYLLNTTQLQIQTVALHCGIMDVQYFSKVFKSKTGKTPREYREAARQNLTV